MSNEANVTHTGLKPADYQLTQSDERNSIDANDERSRKSRQLLTDSALQLCPPDMVYMGSAVVHYYGKVDLLKNQHNAFATDVLIGEALQEVPAAKGLGDLRNKLMAYFGRQEKVRK